MTIPTAMKPLIKQGVSLFLIFNVTVVTLFIYQGDSRILDRGGGVRVVNSSIGPSRGRHEGGGVPPTPPESAPVYEPVKW